MCVHLFLYFNVCGEEEGILISVVVYVIIAVVFFGCIVCLRSRIEEIVAYNLQYDYKIAIIRVRFGLGFKMNDVKVIELGVICE